MRRTHHRRLAAFGASLIAALFAVALCPEIAEGAPVTTWTLTPVACPSTWVALGRGCYDQGAHNFEKVVWEVHEGTTTWTDPTYRVEFTYTVPGTVGPNGASIQLAVNAQALTPGGINGQVCATSTFTFTPTDNCARATAKTLGSASGSQTLNLQPAAGSPGASQIITMYVGSGHIVFTYKASTSPATTSTAAKPAATTTTLNDGDAELTLIQVLSHGAYVDAMTKLMTGNVRVDTSSFEDDLARAPGGSFGVANRHAIAGNAAVAAALAQLNTASGKAQFPAVRSLAPVLAAMAQHAYTASNEAEAREYLVALQRLTYLLASADHKANAGTTGKPA